MTITFDGFSHDAPSSTDLRWASGSYAYVPATLSGRRGLPLSTQYWVERTISPAAGVVLGVNCYVSAAPAGAAGQLAWALLAGGGRLELRLTPGGALQVVQTPATVVCESAATLALAHRDYLEWVLVDGSSPSVAVRVNGVQWAAAAAPALAAGVTAIRLLADGLQWWAIEPLTILPAAGAPPAGPLATAGAAPRAWALAPELDVVADPAWVRSTGAGTQAAHLAPLPFGANSLSASGPAQSEYALADLPAEPGSYLHGLQVSLSARRDGSDGLRLRAGLRHDGVTAWGDWWVPPVAGDATGAVLRTWVWPLQPDGASPWTAAAVAATTLLVESGVA